MQLSTVRSLRPAIKDIMNCNQYRNIIHYERKLSYTPGPVDCNKR